MPIRRREIIENSIRIPGYTSLAIGGVLGYVLGTGISALFYAGIIIIGIAILNYVFVRSVHSAEKKIDTWEKIKYELAEDENG